MLRYLTLGIRDARRDTALDAADMMAALEFVWLHASTLVEARSASISAGNSNRDVAAQRSQRPIAEPKSRFFEVLDHEKASVWANKEPV